MYFSVDMLAQKLTELRRLRKEIQAAPMTFNGDLKVIALRNQFNALFTEALTIRSIAKHK